MSLNTRNYIFTNIKQPIYSTKINKHNTYKKRIIQKFNKYPKTRKRGSRNQRAKKPFAYNPASMIKGNGPGFGTEFYCGPDL